MSIWDNEAAKAQGYPEDYLNWYAGYYKPKLGENAVGVDKAIHIWRSLGDEQRKYEEKVEAPEGTLVASRDAGANAKYITAARDYPDVTAKLNSLMDDSEGKYGYARDLDYVDKRSLFKRLVESGGEYDLKSKEGWQDHKLIYDGEVVNNDVPGNINFGNLGKVFDIPDEELVKAAGVYQIWTDMNNPKKRLWDIVKGFNLDSFGDDPRDTAEIRRGIGIYKKNHP